MTINITSSITSSTMSYYITTSVRTYTTDGIPGNGGRFWSLHQRDKGPGNGGLVPNTKFDFCEYCCTTT